MSHHPSLRRAWSWLRGEPWRLIVATLGLTATVLGLATGVLDLRERLFPDPKPRDPNVEIVVDRSERMGELLPGGQTRLAAAAGQVGEVVTIQQGHNLALRVFGGDCDDESDPVVGFDTDNSKRIRERLADQEPSGLANVVAAVADATTDFADLDRFPNDVVKRIVVVTGGHSCPGDAVQQIRERFRTIGRKRGIGLDFRFIGVDIPPAKRLELREIARELGAGEPFYADDAATLGKALAQAVTTEPTLAAVAAVRRLVAASVGDLNLAKDHIYGTPDRDAADQSLAQARKTVEGTERRFERLGERYGTSDLRELYALARQQRALQLRLLAKLEDDLALADRAEGERTEAVDAAVGRWNDLVATYNENDRAMADLVRRLTK
jgi:hypothetical protein